MRRCWRCGDSALFTDEFGRPVCRPPRRRRDVGTYVLAAAIGVLGVLASECSDPLARLFGGG